MTFRHLTMAALAGCAAAPAVAALGVATDPRLGLADHETLVSLTGRTALWALTGCLAFAAARPLRPAARAER
ncbi:hypothetical protein ACIBSW_28580 [Actinoplanes sp. NPDC049668]|uniref:hypothetical protein n=1 Tax=unclassified Actinoplanes TaxID=2626549 RepID=UPI0033B9CD53